jgi:hypothetical protein
MWEVHAADHRSKVDAEPGLEKQAESAPGEALVERKQSEASGGGRGSRAVCGAQGASAQAEGWKIF